MLNGRILFCIRLSTLWAERENREIHESLGLRCRHSDSLVSQSSVQSRAVSTPGEESANRSMLVVLAGSGTAA